MAQKFLLGKYRPEFFALQGTKRDKAYHELGITNAKIDEMRLIHKMVKTIKDSSPSYSLMAITIMQMMLQTAERLEFDEKEKYLVNLNLSEEEKSSILSLYQFEPNRENLFLFFAKVDA